MPKIKKIKVNDATIYPVTIPEAVVFPDTQKTLSEVIEEGLIPVNVVDNLESDDPEAALSAKQGKVLNTKIENLPSVPAVIDNLTSTSTTNALSAKQGKVLNEKINNLSIPDVIDNLTSTSSVNALSAKQGKVLYDLIQEGEGMNYQKVTQAEYDAAYRAGTLSPNILYIIVG